MPELIAHGNRIKDHWRRPLQPGQKFVIGRVAGDWSIPWDPLISRQHAEITLKNGKLAVRRLKEARNPIYLHGADSKSFELGEGDFFVIGETTFILSDEKPHVASPAQQQQVLQERTISAPELRQLKFQDAPHQIDVLSRLPEVISGSANDGELYARLIGMLLAGIRRAEAVALVEIDPDDDENMPARVLQWDRRLDSAGDFRPSQTLIAEAVRRRRQTVVHAWGSNESEIEFTAAGNFDWAFCTPVLGNSCKGWGIYVAGRFAGNVGRLFGKWETSALADDLKFTELVASIFGSLREVHQLRHRQASLSQFFSPTVMSELAGGDPLDVLKPRETEVTVLFCDLRGFSRESERGASELMALLDRVSNALKKMTQHILEEGGVIGDFHGDAAMGFWGWPVAYPDSALRACRAALGIRHVFQEASQYNRHALAGFKVGIGVATGTAVAGSIGSSDQVKVTVFGPVVNLAARLEGMTKILGAPILIDEATARALKEQMPPDMGRCRRLAKIRPYGMSAPLLVHELLPPFRAHPILRDEDVHTYEEAVDAFIDGDWRSAIALLQRVPPEDDVKDFLTGFICLRHRIPPEEWDGIIGLDSKS